jgi:hypothetical protein
MMSERIIRGGPVRARDLRAAIKELGFEKGVLTTMERFLDEFAAFRVQQRDMVSLLDQCISQVSMMVTVGTSMKNQLEQLKRERDISDEVTHGDQ